MMTGDGICTTLLKFGLYYDQDSIEYMCQEGPKAVFEFEHMGLPFLEQRKKNLSEGF